MAPNELIAAGYRMGRVMLHRMVDDLTASEFTHQPVAGTNSAAWVVGHLGVTARRTADVSAQRICRILTEEFIAKFSSTKKTAEMQNGPGRQSRATAALFDGCVEKLIGAILVFPAEALHNPSPMPGPLATNYGEAVLFGSMHVMFHVRATFHHSPKFGQAASGVNEAHAAAVNTSHRDTDREPAMSSFTRLSAEPVAASSNCTTSAFWFECGLSRRTTQQFRQLGAITRTLRHRMTKREDDSCRLPP